jgi:hypothetical protein
MQKKAMKRFGAVLAATLLTVGVAQSASALSLVVTGPAEGLYAPGTSLTFTVEFDAQTSLAGYELFFTWDQAELSFDSASQLFPDFLPADSFPFVVLDPTLGDASVGIGRASVLQLSEFLTTLIVSFTFTSTGVADEPGSGMPGVSLELSQSAGGLDGGFDPVSVTNPDPYFVWTAVPEPGTMLLLSAGLAGLAFAGRKGRS